MKILTGACSAISALILSTLFTFSSEIVAQTNNDNSNNNGQNVDSDTEVKPQAKIRTTWTEQDRAIVKAANEKLAIDMPDPGLKEGNIAPNFKLKNAFGQTVELKQALAKGPVVLIFYRGAWCPYCNLHLQALQQHGDAFAKYGAQVIAISPQLPDKSAAQVKEQGFAFEILSDTSSKVMQDYQLYFELPKDLLRVYKEHGLDIEKFNGSGRSGLPTPGAFIIDQQGIIRAMQAEVDYTTRMSAEDILTALATL